MKKTIIILTAMILLITPYALATIGNSTNTPFCFDYSNNTEDYFNNNDGTIINNLIYDNSCINNGCYFSNFSNGHIEVDITAQLNRDANFTYVTWFNAEQITGNNEELFGYYNATTGARVSCAGLGNGELRCHAGRSAGNILIINTVNAPMNDTWHMLTYIYKKTGVGTGNLTVWIDNTSSYSVAGNVDEFQSTGHKFQIMQSNDLAGEDWWGYVDQSFLIKKPLTKNEIDYIYNNGNSRNCSEIDNVPTPPTPPTIPTGFTYDEEDVVPVTSNAIVETIRGFGLLGGLIGIILAVAIALLIYGATIKKK